MELGKNKPPDIASAKPTQFPGRGEPEQNGVDGDFLLGKQRVELLLACMTDYDLPPGVPLGGEQGDVGGNEGADTFECKNDFEGSRRAGSTVAAIKIKASCYHKP